jgi:hypothetical protein
MGNPTQISSECRLKTTATYDFHERGHLRHPNQPYITAHMGGLSVQV